MKNLQEKEPIYSNYKSVLTLENFESLRKVCKTYLITIFINIAFAIICLSLIISGSTFLESDPDKTKSLFLIAYLLLIPFVILFIVDLVLNFIMISKSNFYKSVTKEFNKIFILFIIGVFIGITSIVACFSVFKKITELAVD
ncbi:MAG: hypothetical protein K2J02_02485 [Malacoplasma sp.]|nr:hypothetical protein [Malacoplasma sp.]